MTENYATVSQGDGAVLALAFASGKRPDAGALVALSGQGGLATPFAVTHIAPEADSWAELLTAGLAFDCHGLMPGRFLAPEPNAALLGLAEAPSGEVIGLQPAPHLAEGGGLLPVVRALAGLGAQLCQLPGVQGVYWRPAHCWMASKYFTGVIAEWLKGGPFPGLGLTSLRHAGDGAMVSVGLDYLIGQELFFPANRKLAPAALARIAVRLVNDLVTSGPLLRDAEWTGPEGELVAVEPVGSGNELRVTVTA